MIFKVHGGFLHVYNLNRLIVRDQVKAYLDRGWQIIFTGHSLGGAVATLAMLDNAAEFDIPDSRVSLITFGSPRVGDESFMDHVNENYLDCNMKRMVSVSYDGATDVVTTVPSAGYYHVQRKEESICRPSSVLPDKLECHFLDQYKDAISDGLYDSHNTVICSGRGRCGREACMCSKGWGGSECQVMTCNGLAKTNKDVCSGRGKCTEPDVCECEEKYYGKWCQFKEAEPEPEPEPSPDPDPSPSPTPEPGPNPYPRNGTEDVSAADIQAISLITVILCALSSLLLLI